MLLNIICGFVITGFILTVLTSEEPSGPAAIGRALGLLVLLETVGPVLIGRLFEQAFNVTLHRIPEDLGPAIILALFCGAPMMSGFIAARTKENTRAMNCKILAIFGFIPHCLISTAVQSSGTYTAIAIFSFFPMLGAGGWVRCRLFKGNAGPG